MRAGNGAREREPPMDAKQYHAEVVRKLRYLKSESHSAINVYKIRDLLKEILELAEYILTGQMTGEAQFNQVPGQAIGEDPNKQRVEFFKDNSANNLDAGGQRVEFIGGPTITPPVAPAPPAQPVTSPATGQAVAPQPMGSVEAGGHVQPNVGAPQTREELLARLPIPVQP
jgi:hypothetical protein